MVTWHYECFLVVMGCYWVATGGNGWSGVVIGIKEVVLGGRGVVTFFLVVMGGYGCLSVDTGYGWLGMGPSRPTP